MTKRKIRSGAAAVLLSALCLQGCASPQAVSNVPNYIQVETVNNEETITIQASRGGTWIPA